jgi:hypothetical protein
MINRNQVDFSRSYCDTTVTPSLGVLEPSSFTNRTMPVMLDPLSCKVVLWSRYWAKRTSLRLDLWSRLSAWLYQRSQYAKSSATRPQVISETLSNDSRSGASTCWLRRYTTSK